MKLCRLLCLPVLLFFSSQVFAVCEDGNNRLRGKFELLLPASGVLLRVRQADEPVEVQVSDQANTLRMAHPGGTGIDHFILLDSRQPLMPGTVEVCLLARYDQSQAGSFEIEEIPLTTFSGDEITLLQEMTQAAILWAEDRAETRTQALAIYQESALRAEALDGDLHAHALLFAAIAHIRQSQHMQSFESLEALAALNLSDPVLLYKATWKEGEAHLRLNQHAPALIEFQRAIELIKTRLQGEAGPAHRDLTEIRILLTETLIAQRNPDAARTQIDLAFETAGSEYRLLGSLYNVLGYLHISDSQQEELTLAARRKLLGDAIDVMLTGRFLSQTASDPVTLASIENNLGFVYDRLGEYGRALEHYRQILSLVDPAEDPLVYRFAYSNLGRLYQYMADYPRSESYYRQAVSLAEAASGSVSTTRCALGTTLRLNGNSHEALTEHSVCLRQAELTGNHAAMVLARHETGEDYLALGDEESAWEHLQWAWEQSAQNVSAAMRSRVLRRYADMLQRRGQAAEATASISEAIALHTQQLSPVDIVENHAMAMQIAMQQGDTEQAENHAMLAIQLIEAQYEELESERQGPTWSARTHEIYVQLAEYYLQLYFAGNNEEFLRKAFDITERSRAISLRQHFANRMADSRVNNSNNPADNTSRQIAEQAQIAMISRIANEHAIVQSNSESEITLPANYYHHQDVLSLHRLGSLTQLPLPAALTIADIQAQLPRNQAVLYYLMANQNSYVFTVTATTLTVNPLEVTQGATQLIASARQSLADSNSSPYPVLAQLSETLLGAVQLADHIDELLIVPHGTLHGLPFAALPQPGSSRYEPLVSRYALQTVPSMTSYLMDKPFNNRSGDTDIAIFADPVFDATQLGQQLLALEPAATDILRGWSEQLQRLPNTAVEAQNLVQLFSEQRTILLTGERASRSNLARQDIRNARVLHIATHGYFNAANDDNVGLGFSVIDENGQPDSGFVTLPELFSYRFNNELVVISGCDTAMGRPLAGEGMMGLTRGFIAQGAKHVIATLWPVSDRASADFMAIFYRQLLELGNVARALQSAQNELRENPAYRAPFYWAAYTLSSVSADQHMNFDNISVNP